MLCGYFTLQYHLLVWKELGLLDNGAILGNYHEVVKIFARAKILITECRMINICMFLNLISVCSQHKQQKCRQATDTLVSCDLCMCTDCQIGL